MAFIGQRSKSETIEGFRDHVSSGKVAFFAQYGMDFVPGRREGVYLWDVEGDKRLVNCHCNGGVFNLGHRHPAVVDTLVRAVDELDIGNHHFISEQRAALARRLAELAPGEMPYSVFAVGGGEAIDFALKLARAHTERPGIISVRGGYHGHTGLALAAGDAQYRDPFGPMPPGFVQVPFGDVAAIADRINGDTAAVILETIPATLGMPIAPQGYFAELRALCDRYGALLIVDEVQSGLGRTGKMWAIEHWGVEPDILVTGKGLSGGVYPIAATCYRSELNAFMEANPFIHISTFGGAEIGLCCGPGRTGSDGQPCLLGACGQIGGALENWLPAASDALSRHADDCPTIGTDDRPGIPGCGLWPADDQVPLRGRCPGHLCQQ